jgi:hypothetical protein
MEVLDLVDGPRGRMKFETRHPPKQFILCRVNCGLPRVSTTKVDTESGRPALFRDYICASGKEVKPVIGEEPELIGSGRQGHGECQSSRGFSA